ncbi:M14 family metallopeptidase [Aquibacillus salsiterrae]|uniref:M14 family metallocarboxypeptidase n=1 Tax=Aquibacillus salsiterrae TaxID=2950439 RepID=A0A9X3WB49_9BACI|nr:M14 family metallocarboxypeptidase [Aquibacillus salsiterrae]MDC3416207.1 M14 family metallocarboxypeptidase [Aquibacillus salsiterrae]
MATLIVNPKQLYGYEQLQKDLAKLETTYQGLLSTQIIGKSVDHRNIYAVKLGNGKSEIFLNGAHHAREWLTTSLLMNMIDVYCKAYVEEESIGEFDVRNILDNTTIWFVPMVNPDGVELVQKGHENAKNPEFLLELNDGQRDFSSWKANIRGVDLNRQYPADWGNIADDVGQPAPMMFKGNSPLSEPETKAVYEFTLAHDFKLAVAYHSSGEELFWKYNATGQLLKTARKLADKIVEKTGYDLVFPGDNPSGGGYTDWFIDSLKRPAFTPEISPLVGPRPVPLSNYDKIWQDNKEIGLLLAAEIGKKYVT